MKRRTKKIIQFAFVLIIVSVIGNVLMYSFNLSPFNVTVTDLKRSVSATNISDLHIKSNSGDVNIVAYDGTEILAHMKVKSEKRWVDDYQLSLKENGSKVTIEAKEIAKTRLFSINPGQYELDIQLPRKDFERIQVQTDVADINVDSVQAEQSFLDASYGNITANKLRGNINGVTEVGNINIQLQTVENDIEAKTTYGDITIATEVTPKAIRTNLVSGLGERTIHWPGDGSVGIGGPNVKLSAGVGDLALLLRNN